jgi:nucleotide-binding universal stress UspA family protein
MKKILVTTDFSAASKAGIRFAIQLSKQLSKPVELVFLNCFEVLIPTTIHRERIEKSMAEQYDSQTQKLQKFILGVYKSLKVAPTHASFAVVDTYDPYNAILEFAYKNHFDYICMSTRGAGTLKKIVGTTASTIIQSSRVPVIAVPAQYRIRALNSLLYTSDLENFELEMTKVMAFGQELNAKIEIGHFYYPGEVKLEHQMLQELWQKKFPGLTKTHLEPFHARDGFGVQLDQLIQKRKPGLVVFFTHTNKTLFDKLFSTSKSATFSFTSKVPMLVFRKSS